MYEGIKRKTANHDTKKIRGKFQMLTKEEIEENGIISNQLVFKTKKYERDETVTWKNFEIANLLAAGINPNTLPTTILPMDTERLAERADKAETKLDMYEIINEIEREENEPTTEQTEQ